MMRLIKADFKKLFFLAKSRHFLLATIFLSILFGVILLLTINVTEGRTLTELSGIEVVDITYLGMDVATIMMIIYAALFLSNNITNEAVHFNLAITPNRFKFFMAKISFVSLLSLFMGLIVLVSLTAVSQIIMSFNSMGRLELFTQASLLKMIGSLLMIIVYSLLSATVIFFGQSAAVGITFSLGLMFLPALVRMFPEFIGDILLPIFPETSINVFIDLNNQANNSLLALIILSIWLIITGAISYRKFKYTDY